MIKNYLLKTIGLFTILSFSLSAQNQKTNSGLLSSHYKIKQGLIENKDFLTKTIICKVKPEHAQLCSPAYINHPQVINLLNLFQVQQLAKKFPQHKSPERKFNSLGQAYIDLSLIYELKYNGSISLEKAINKLLETGIFEYAEPHFLPYLVYNPSDTLSDSTHQYHLDRIEAYSGWNINKGDTNVVIAIVDTGTDPLHQDLSANIKHNYADPVNGTDDDQDGYTDNFSGWDLGMADNDPIYVANAHGVHVSGIAAAKTDNITGIAGVGFKCKFLPVKIAEDAGGALIAAYEGIAYAADHGAQIINCSWGGGGTGTYGQDIINYASINKGALVVSAAGNNGSFEDFFPASYDNVISVASTNAADARSAFSNFSYNVDVCAPGSQIVSTWPGNTYIPSDGTSMASPCAAGVAAIIKANFPTYTGLQVGEQLKATTDYIYNINGSYINKLGTGRVNMYKALTQLNTKSIVMTSRAIVDSNDNVFIVGDTLFIRGVFTNFLSAVTGASASVKPFLGGNYLTQVDTLTALGNMATLGTANNYADPFKFVINAGTPQNQQIVFKLRVFDGTYSANYFFTITVNVDYINIKVNDVFSTITSKGKIGYNKDQQAEGLGFKYNGIPLLYEAGLMIGSSPAIVSDCIRGDNGTNADTDFVAVNTVHEVIPHVVSEFDLTEVFSDAHASPSQDLLITQNTYAWSTPGNTKYIIIEYFIKNNGANLLDSMFAGICADWDVDAATYASNKSDYDAVSKMGYTWCTNNGGKYAGIKLLTHTAPPVFYGVDNVSGGGGGIDLVVAGFTTPLKYTVLSTQRSQAGNTATAGNDVLNVMSSGPFTLNAGDTAKVAFALLAGDNLLDIQKSADSAQFHYDGTHTFFGINQQNTASGIKVYPNPASNNLSFVFQNTRLENTSISIVNMLGQTVQTIPVNNTAGGSTKINADISNLQNGTYFYRINTGDKLTVGKIIISK